MNPGNSPPEEEKPSLRGILFWGFFFLFIIGCSGESHPPLVFPYPPIPSSITVNGFIDLADVAVHPSSGGVFPGIKAGISPSFLDYSGFKIEVEDDSTVSSKADAKGNFNLKDISLRHQLVLRCSDTRHPGLILEWMAMNKIGLFGTLIARVTVESTARSYLTRAIRDRYGALISPETIPQAYLIEIMENIFLVLEQKPEKISASTSLEQVAEVKGAVASAAGSFFPKSSPTYFRDWTILVYQGADNSLENAILTDLNEMKAADISDRVAVIVQIDTPDEGIRRLRVEKDQVTEFGRSGPGDSANSAYIADLVGWGRRVFPAPKIALILASHGSGWRANSFSRGFLVDDSAGSFIGLPQLKGALNFSKNIFDGFERPLDLLGFDACLMGMLEVAFQVRGTTKYLVFSQGNEPGNGLPYEKILTNLSANAGTHGGKEFGTTICDEYHRFFSTNFSNRYSGTMSLINMVNIDSFFKSFSSWTEKAFLQGKTVFPLIAGIRDAFIDENETFPGPEKYRVQAFDYIDYRDLKGLVEVSRQNIPELFIESEELLKHFPGLIEYSKVFGTRYSRATGLSISLPSAREINEYLEVTAGKAYGLLDLSAQSKWDEILVGINQTGLTRVDGRGLKITLSWIGSDSLDLYIGEPENFGASGSEKILWYSSSGGAQTPGGQFDVAGLIFNDQVRKWMANSQILAGNYWVVVKSETGQAVSSVVVSISWVGGKIEMKKANFPANSQWQAALVSITKDGIAAKEIPKPE